MMSMAIVAKTGKPSERETKAVKKEEEEEILEEGVFLPRKTNYFSRLFIFNSLGRYSSPPGNSNEPMFGFSSSLIIPHTVFFLFHPKQQLALNLQSITNELKERCRAKKHC